MLKTTNAIYEVLYSTSLQLCVEYLLRDRNIVFIHKMIVISCQVMTLGWYGDQIKARAAHSLFLREDVATPWTSFLFAGHAKCEHEH